MSLPPYPRYRESGIEWLGEVPEHWKSVRLGALFREAGDVGSEDLPILSVSIHDGVSDREYSDEEQDRKVTRSEDKTKYKRVQPGDLVYNMMRAWQGGFGSVTVPGMVSPAYVVARPLTEIRTEFIEQLLRTPQAIEELRRHSHGVTDFRLRLYWDEFRSINVALPTAREQSEILDHVRPENAKIEALIAEQQRLIELLKEKRQSIISRAVTKGLNPDATMGESGVEWMSKVPEHWELFALKWVTENRCDGPFGSGLKSEHYVETGVRVIRLQNIRQGTFDDTDAAFVDEMYHREELNGHEVVSGDLLIAGLGDDRNTVGRTCVAPSGIEPAMVKADCFRFRLNKKLAVPHFVALQLTAGSSFDAGKLASGSTRSRIPLSVMASRTIALPPLTEQQFIVDLVQQRSAACDALIAEAQLAINLLQERRAGLMSAAVTGKIDVRHLPETAREKDAA